MSLTVSAVENEDGTIAIGVTKDGTFVPIAEQPANIVRHYTEDVPKPESSKRKTKTTEEGE